MKTINKILITLLILGLTGMIVYLLLKPEKPPKEIIVTNIKYKDSPLTTFYKKRSDSLEKIASEKKKVFYKYITIYKDTLKIQHDTIVDVLFIGNDIIQLQDSVIKTKDSLILDLTRNLNLQKDTSYYFYTLYTNEKSKVKKWKRISIASLLANGILIIK